MNSRFHLIQKCLVLALCLGGVSRAEDTTQSHLSKYGDKLAGAWTAHPMPKDDLIRKQKIQDLTAAFPATLKELSPPPNITLQRVVGNFLSNLEKTRGLFKADKMSAEKSAYTTACATVFKYELPQSSDSESSRKASKCFDQLMTWSEEARTKMRVIPEEAHGVIFTNLTEAFTLMLKFAEKDDGDPTAIYEQNLKEVQRRFPVSTPALQKNNQAAKAMLETAAKQVMTFNKK